MKFIKFNKRRISKLSLGTVQFGLDYGIANSSGKPTQKKANNIISYVTKNGINSFDTAAAYGSSEKVLGIALKNKKNINIVSKLTSDMFIDNPKKNMEKTLKNLKQKSIFGLLLHDSMLLYNWKKEYSDQVKLMKKTALIKYFGVSIYTDDEFQLALKNDNVNIIQIPFNIFDQRACKKKWLNAAKKKNKLIFIRSIFLQGLLLMKKDNIPSSLKKAEKYIRKLDAISKELNINKSELALNFVNTIAKDSILLFGCDNKKQAKENINNFVKIKDLDQKSIKRLKKLFENVEEEIYNPSLWEKV